MNIHEIKKMRVKQMIAINILIVAATAIYFIFIGMINITHTQLFFALGMLILCQAIVALFKEDPTNLFIPIFKQVAVYEKEKMGSEWKKQQKSSNIGRFLLSALLFFQSYMYLGMDRAVQIDFMFMLFVTIPLVVLVNLSLLLHIRKVDRSSSEADLKGFTWKFNLIAVVGGIAFGAILFVLSIWLILTSI